MMKVECLNYAQILNYYSSLIKVIMLGNFVNCKNVQVNQPYKDCLVENIQ